MVHRWRNCRIQAGYYSANPNGYYERGWVHQSAPINESDERVPESEGRERRYAYGAGMRLEGQQKFGLEVPQQQRERLEAPPPVPPQPPRQEEQPSLERIRELNKQADEAMSDLSEATLDSLMATIIAAKNKLAERRTQREQGEKRASEANKFPPRYV